MHREVELCRKCKQFRLILDPLKGWLVLTDEAIFKSESFEVGL